MSKAKVVSIALLCVLFCCTPSWGQVTITNLQIDVRNAVGYLIDTPDNTKLATDPNVTQRVPTRNFGSSVLLGDIVAVNSKPAKGLLGDRIVTINTSQNAMPGQAIADVDRSSIVELVWEIRQADGTPVGSIVALGFSGGSVSGLPPGAPPTARQSDFAIIGGTGAFLGARGQAVTFQSDLSGTGALVASRPASATEDPANRRANGGRNTSYLLQLVPLFVPAVVATASGPAVVHASDSSLVTAAKPAKSGEVLTLYATGLGPTRPALEPGKVFTADLLQVANSPIEVTVGGQAAEVLYAGGYPGTADGFQVNFRLPSGMVPGVASLQVTAAFIQGREVSIPIQ
jgi:uncharacterized protein (TIGR03437 family)